MGKGRSPVRDEVDYVLVRRQAEKGRISRFLSVLDPYQAAPQVSGVRLVSAEPLVIEVALEGEIHEVTLNPAESPVISSAHRDMGVRVVAKRQGAVVRDIAIGAIAGAGSAGWANGVVTAIENGWTGSPAISVTLDDPAQAKAFAIGRWVRIHSERRSAMYRIMACESLGGNALRLILDKTLLLGEGDLVSAKEDLLLLDPEMILAREWRGATVTLDRAGAAPSGAVAYARSSGEIKLECPASGLGNPAQGTHVYIWEFCPGARIETPLVRGA